MAEAKNSELQSEREAAEARLAELAAEESAPAGYGAPAEYGVPATEAPVAIEAKEGYGAPDDYEAAASDDDYAVYEYDQAPIVEARQSQYEARAWGIDFVHTPLFHCLKMNARFTQIINWIWKMLDLKIRYEKS